jgi:hypothetical protein
VKEIATTDIKISDFPPSLRRLGQFMINSGQLMSLKEACESTNINYSSVRTEILRCKKKGLDFHRFVDDYVLEKLRNARPDVYKSLQDRAIDGSAKHIELFMKAVGDFKERHETTLNVGLMYVFGGSQMPDDLKEEYEERRKIVDVTTSDK